MSTCSANTTGLPDRRHFLSTLATASALGLPAMPAFAAAPGPIERMYAKHVLLSDAVELAIEARVAAEVGHRADAAGLTKARQAAERAQKAADEHAAAVFAIDPSTFREVAFQGAVLQLTGWDDPRVLDLLERLTALADIT